MVKVSIIVPVYNYELYLERCVDSLRNQSLKELEILLVDDGSTDHSPEICDKLAKQDERITVIHKKNGGLSDSRNVGIKHANGEYVGFVDADDWVAPEMYKEMFDICIDNNVDICSSKYAIVHDESDVLKQLDGKVTVYEGQEKLKVYFENGLSNRSNQYSACTKLYKKSLFEEIQFPLGVRFEDMITNMYLIEKSDRFAIYNKYLYYYFMNSVSITRNKFSKRDLDLVDVSNQMYEHVKDTQLEGLGRSIYGRSFFSLLLKIIRYGFDDSVDEPQKTFENLYSGYSANYEQLRMSNIPLNRKIIMPFLRYFPRTMRKCYSAYRSIKNA